MNGLAEGEAKGLALGKVEEKINIAKKLKSQGIPINVIITATGLSKEDIENL